MTMTEHNDSIEKPATLTLQQRQTYDNQERFLRAYATHGKMTRAADAAGISRNTVEFWQRTDSHGFNKRLQLAHDKYVESWEQLMDERLADPKGNRGSDILLMIKLKSERPEKYREDVKVQGLEPLTALLEEARKLAARDIERRRLEEGSVEAEYRDLGENEQR
jgi:hypothetical protein